MTIREYKKKSFRYTLVMGIAAIVLAFAIDAIGVHVDYRILLWLVGFGFVMLSGSLFIYFRYKRHPDVAEGDERTQKLGGVAMLYTWLLSMLFIFILLALNYLGIVKMTATFALCLALAFMFVTGFGLYFLLLSRGDVP